MEIRTVRIYIRLMKIYLENLNSNLNQINIQSSPSTNSFKPHSISLQADDSIFDKLGFKKN